jgi:geranylgeranyl pyrophosphate synthase
MKREEYFTFLQETSNSVSPVIEKYVEPFLDSDREIYNILMHFIKRRLNKRLLKPALLRLSYEICGGKDWEKVIPAAAAFELINISSYQANSAFDNKLGVFTQPEKDSQFIAAMITREIAAKAASELKKDFSDQVMHKVYESLTESNYHIYLAQHYDLNLLNVVNYEHYLKEEIYLREYYKRCFYGSGIFNGLCAYVGALLAGGNPDQQNALRSFGENYGTALQIVNDIGDYIPTGIDSMINRTFQDQWQTYSTTISFTKIWESYEGR